ncbi:MAG: hypothetical protein ABI898_12675 [Sphingomonadales bacterium]
MQNLTVVALVLLAAVTPARAQNKSPPQITRTATVFGNDPCPKAVEDEIVVCGRLPESERYRIPKAFRQKPREDSGPGASWSSRVETLEAAQRYTMPGSCTVNGSFGQTGCTQAMIRQWFLERRAAAADPTP